MNTCILIYDYVKLMFWWNRLKKINFFFFFLNDSFKTFSRSRSSIKKSLVENQFPFDRVTGITKESVIAAVWGIFRMLFLPYHRHHFLRPSLRPLCLRQSWTGCFLLAGRRSTALCRPSCPRVFFSDLLPISLTTRIVFVVNIRPSVRENDYVFLMIFSPSHLWCFEIKHRIVRTRSVSRVVYDHNFTVVKRENKKNIHR